MKHLDLVCVSADRDATLEKLRELGAVHLDFSGVAGAGVAAAKGAAADAEKAVRAILKARKENPDEDRRARSVREVLAILADAATLAEARENLEREIRKYEPYGDFDPALAAKLAQDGIALLLNEDGSYSVDAKSVRVPVDAKSVRVPVDAKSVRVPVDAKSVRVEEEESVLIGRGKDSASTVGRGKDSASTVGRGKDSASTVSPVPYPAMRLSRMREKLARIVNRANIDRAKLACCDEAAILKEYPALADKIAFESARELMANQGAVSVISGWVPETTIEGAFRRNAPTGDSVCNSPNCAADDAAPSRGCNSPNCTKSFKQVAREAGWGYLLRDPDPGEIPPTLVEPPKVFRPMKALFDGLGISPAYTEADVSVPFMCYFSLFFAMLVGDGAYGAIFLAATLWGWLKYRRINAAARSPVAKSWLILMTVFSSATIVWGLLSNTWFGAGLPWCASWPTVKWLADPSYHNMMLLCFTIGVSHLMLARIWNGISMINDSTSVAQFGWAGILLFMYLVTNSIVGIFPGIPVWGYYVFGVSLVAVFGFSVKPSELKTRGAELGMLPLNIMSALGDIISYVRLFAVGLASVKVAENFNQMATGLVTGADAVWLKAILSVAMVAILVVGHALNLAMAGLSILVHAVRLNTLEFSNHKGVSWAGYAFRAFKRAEGRGSRAEGGRETRN